MSTLPTSLMRSELLLPVDAMGSPSEQPPDEVVVRLESVAKNYTRGSETVAVLQDCSLEINRGDFMALVGPSGSGKTTLLNLIGGLDHPSSGRVIVGDVDVSRLSESALARWRTSAIGFVFQFYHLIPVLNAYENVELPLLLMPMSRRRRREQVLTSLELVGLSHRLRHRPGELSGGEQQRVGIARALATDPRLIVADEPTGDLDGERSEEILDLLQELSDNLHKTILLVTHDAAAAVRARRIISIQHGSIIEGGREILTQMFPTHLFEQQV